MKIKIIKLGGSVITNNNLRDKFDWEITSRIGQELLEFYPGTVIIHGTGVVGKEPALKYGYNNSGVLGKEMKQIAIKIKSEIKILNQNLINCLSSVGIPVLSMEPLLGSKYKVDKKNLAKVLMSQKVPVYRGDLILLKNGSHIVVSSDYIVFYLTKLLRPENVIFLTDVDGLFIKNPKHYCDSIAGFLPEINPEIYKSLIITRDENDVSGGMKNKVELALKCTTYSKSCFIGNGYTTNLISDYLKHKKVKGTYVK